MKLCSLVMGNNKYCKDIFKNRLKLIQQLEEDNEGGEALSILKITKLIQAYILLSGDNAQ